ncbi:MAG: transporter substrate-binding domain-containing protein, partial [Bryobacteraceae bacterium]|nr:transporter substrate-binding domain-containing protein [Bryobacteraceae bacterium]
MSVRSDGVSRRRSLSFDMPLNAGILKRHGRLVFAVLLAVFTVVMIGVWNAKQGTPERLRIGFIQFQPPYIVVAPDGKPGGMAFDILSEAARRAGVDLDWVPITGSFDDALDSGQIEMYPLARSSERRREKYLASSDWWDTPMVLVSRRDRPLRTVEAAAGRNIAIRDLPFIRVSAPLWLPGAQFITKPEIADIFSALCSSKVEGFLLDSRIVQATAFEEPSALCNGIHVIPVQKGVFGLATMAVKSRASTADRIFDQISNLEAEGEIVRAAERWRVVAQVHTIRVRRALEWSFTKRLTWGVVGAFVILLILNYWHVKRTKSARGAAEDSDRRFHAFMDNTSV